jgi:filamentous hemagglutinin family protein
MDNMILLRSSKVRPNCSVIPACRESFLYKKDCGQAAMTRNLLMENMNKDNKEGKMLSRLKTQRILKGAMVSIILCMFMLIPAMSHALPQGGNVTGGSASISTPDPSTMNITQTTNKAIINWQGFSIDVNELVKFIQPGSSAVALNRVVGVDPSSILGQLVANGNIFLVNPNGIVFGPNSTVDTAGLLATTLNIKDSDFMSDNYSFFQDQDKALSYIINKGKIVINDNGFAVLVAPLVSNEGLIIANL